MLKRSVIIIASRNIINLVSELDPFIIKTNQSVKHIQSEQIYLSTRFVYNSDVEKMNTTIQ